MIKHIATSLNDYLLENIQLAFNVYFSTNKISSDDKDIILKITNSDNYTKVISDFCYFFNENNILQYNETIKEKLELLYGELKKYNKNKYPIYGLDISKGVGENEIYNIYSALETRKKIIDLIDKLPSVATRNMKSDIREIRSSQTLTKYLNDLEYFMANFSYLSNRDEETQMKFIRKMFKNNTTLDDLMKFIDDKESFLGGVEFTKDSVRELSKEEDIEIIYERDNIMIVEVESPEGIKAIGCNSLWCFTYGSGYNASLNDWNNYSYNGMVYVLIDFNMPTDGVEFMHVVISPLLDDDNELIEYDEDNEDEHPIFTMMNDNWSDPYIILDGLFGDNYKDIITKYLNFGY